MSGQQEKACGQCKRILPLATGFYKCRTRSDGVKFRCKDCERQWRLDSKYNTASKLRRVKRHPEKEAANKAVQRAIRLGELIRPAVCSKCKKPCTPHGHHPDYSKQLEVIWLCWDCHRALHQAERPVGKTKQEWNTQRREEYNRRMEYELEVCGSCLRAVCWWGLFYCDDYQTADTKKMKVRDLIRLGREHKSYLTSAMIEKHTGVRP